MVFDFLQTFRSRTYHKDSYITQRRGECLGQEGRYRRTSSPSTSATSFSNPFSSNSQGNTKNQNVFGLNAKEDFHRSLLQDDKNVDGRHDVTNIHADPRVGLASPQHELSSVTSGWNDVDSLNEAFRHRHSSGFVPTSTTSTISFTSDALKTLRKNQLLPESQTLSHNPPPPDLNSMASKLTRPAPNFLASAATYSRRRKHNSFQKAAGSLAAKSCLNLLVPEGRSVSKQGMEQVIFSTSTTSKYQPNETSPFEMTQNNHFLKNDSMFTIHRREKLNDKSSWSKSRVLQPAKSTPSLLHINDESASRESKVHPVPREGLVKLSNVELLRPNFSDVSENNDTSLTSDGDEDMTIKRDSMVSSDINTIEWKNSLESLLDNDAMPNEDQNGRELASRNKMSSVDNLHLKPPATLSSSDGRTTSSSKTSSLGSYKGHSSAFVVRQGRNSRMSSNASSTASSAPSSVDQQHTHSHSNSDSGLSSLTGGVGGGAFGRTSTMSPVSTLSTLSSISSSSSVASTTSNASSVSGNSRQMNRKNLSTTSSSQRLTCGLPKTSIHSQPIHSDVAITSDVIMASSGGGMQTKPYQLNSNDDIVYSQNHSDQILSSAENVKRSTSKSNNLISSTEYKKNMNLIDISNIENGDEEGDSGNNLDSGNGTMRVKPGNNRALRGLYNGWYDGNRNGGALNKFQEEIECEELSAEFVRRLSWQLPEKCSPRLQELFVPSPTHKTPSDYMEGILFSINDTTNVSNSTKLVDNDESPPPLPLRQPRVVRPPVVVNTKKSLVSPSTLRRKIEELKSDNSNQCNSSSASHRAFSPSNNELTDTTKTNCANEIRLPPNDKQFYNASHVSEMKFHHVGNEDSGSSVTGIIGSHSDFKGIKTSVNKIEEKHGLPRPPSINGNIPMTRQESFNGNARDGVELQQKKDELLQRISRKLDVLRSEDMALKEEMSMNEELGSHVSSLVESSCTKQSECLKYRLHVEEIDKITSLLLGLSGRLARTENSIAALEVNTSNIIKDNHDLQEKKILESKRAKLMEQLDEAKRLKESIDRRSSMVSQFLQNYLSESDYADYEHFVKMKAKLIMDSREITDKIKLGEEQLQALKDSIVNSPSAKNNKNNSSRSISYNNNATVGCDNNVFESKTTL